MMPVNCTDIIECYNYNMTKILSDDVVSDGAGWLGNFNELMGGFFIIGCLILVGLVLYFLMKGLGNDDVDSVSYSGIIITVMSILLFLVNTGTDTKLISWEQISIVVILTAFALGVAKMSKNY